MAMREALQTERCLEQISNGCDFAGVFFVFFLLRDS